MKHLTIEGIEDFLRKYPQAKILDVCSKHEQESKAFRGNVHLVSWYSANWEPNPDFIELVGRRISQDDFVLVICRNGVRSAEAAFLLEKSGFGNVYNVLGGYDELRKSPSLNRLESMAGAYF